MLSLPVPAPLVGAGTRDRLENRRHIGACCCAAAAVTATLLGWTPTSAMASTVALAAVAIGLPHGAFDIVIGPRMFRPSAFFPMYMTVAAIMLLMWLLVPFAGLVTFFVASWFHFARGDAAHHGDLRRAGHLLGASTAGCAIGLPLALHATLVVPVLSVLLLGTATPTAEHVSVAGWMIVCPSIITGGVAAFAALRGRRYPAVVEVATIALLAAVVHPLISFALYFALWHSPRHLIALGLERKSAMSAACATAASLAMGTIAWHVCAPSAATATRGVFVALAALTVPHLVVTEYWGLAAAHFFGRATNVAVADIALPSRE